MNRLKLRHVYRYSYSCDYGLCIIKTKKNQRTGYLYNVACHSNIDRCRYTRTLPAVYANIGAFGG